VSTELLIRAAKLAHNEYNAMHYQYNDQSWGRAPEDVFQATMQQLRRRWRQQQRIENELSYRGVTMYAGDVIKRNGA
jgi:hypothetical protein